MELVENVHILFDEQEHKYTDTLGNSYTSVTQLISKYEEKEDFYRIAKSCEKAGRNPNHPKYLKYRGKTAKQLLREWKEITETSLDRGNERHGFLEDNINKVNGYDKIKHKYIGDRIYTVYDLLDNNALGLLNLSKFNESDVKDRFPSIHKVISNFHNLGYSIYSEVCVYNPFYLVSGLIDVPLIKDNTLIILDWKTNRGDIRYEAGYYEKDNDGNLLNFVIKPKFFKYPLDHLECSVGNKYALQLSTYMYMAEHFGFKPGGILLTHIKHDKDDNNKEIVDIMPVKYLREEVKSMFEHHRKRLQSKRKTQFKLAI